jgi:type IV pilus assembly protein PilY1
MLCAGLTVLFAGTTAAVDLADAPLFSTVVVPGNLALALSVEWPTATTPAYTSAYAASSTYLGYFDPLKCYQYIYNSTTPSSSYFTPYSYDSSAGHTCSSSASVPLWSGNFLNWMSMQTLDTFRWVLTGGYRSVDTTSETILTKTYAGYDSISVMPNKSLSNSSTLAGGTPLTWNAWNSRVNYLGTAVYFTGTGTSSTTWTGNGGTGYTDYDGQNSYVSSTITTTGSGGGRGGPGASTTTENPAYAKSATIYRLFINVKVCDSSVAVEDNCTAYGSNYKPEGLLQKYALKLRYSAFGYYNDDARVDGGVMRSRMKYIAPTKPVPGSSAVENSAMEWDADSGVMLADPDSTDASATVARAKAAGWTVSITDSGVMNYLNKFGYSAQSYKSKDPVGELYYAATRYFRNLGNVASYTSLSGAGSAATAKKWLDGFPAIAEWDDPIVYSCQKNFILGIGDTYSWYDTNLPGRSLTNSSEPSLPSEVSNDTTVNVTTANNMVGMLEGYSSTLGTAWNASGRGNTMYIAGLAYDAHTKDIRSDLAGKQTINTYWLDVHENQKYEHKNQYWLAAKYGGFEVPDGFSAYADSNTTTTIGEKAWCTSDDTLPFSGTTYATSNGLSFSTDSGSTDKRPDNYFPGNSPATMKSSLTAAFEKIVSEATTASSTTLSSSDDRDEESGNANYRVFYDPNTWTSTLKGQLVSYDNDGEATYEDVWNATTLLDGRTSGDRLIVTCCASDGSGLPFTNTSLTGSSLISRTYYESFKSVVGVSSASQSIAKYIDYLRGNTTYELDKNGPYRTRSHLLGDIVNAELTAVGPPDFSYYELYNPGYKAFKSTYASRPTVVYAGANDGMLHAFDGTVPESSGAACTSSLTTPSSACGKELFAYIPSFVYGNATASSSSGLASLGNPSSFTHHYFVDGTPVFGDVDFYKTKNPAASSNDWRTIVVGGLGKGGKGYYALDVTNPSAWTSETAVAGKVLWEFSGEHMGYSYDDPVIVKTPEFGWTVVLASGYNNDDDRGYLYLVNPRTGALLKTIALPDDVTTEPINLAHVEAYVPNAANGVADALYAGDLQGNIWRIDLTAATTTSGTTAATASYDYTIVQLASLTDSSGVVQPVSTRVLIEPDPASGKRYVLVGTGQLLSDNDSSATQVQSFYAIIDGTDGYGEFYNTASAITTSSGSTSTSHSGVALPTSVSFPITREVMAANTDLTTGIDSSTAVLKPMGWYFDLPTDSATGIAERVNVRPDVTDGIVGFAGNLPNGDACSPSGTAHGYAVSFADGVTVLADGVASLTLTSTVTDVAFKVVNGTVRLYFGQGDGTAINAEGSYEAKTVYKRLNWREVPTAD